MSKQNPRVCVYCSSLWYTHIAVTVTRESPTYIFTVQYPSGTVFFSNTPKVDVFESQVAAGRYIKSKFQSNLIADGTALIGLSISPEGEIIYAIIQRAKEKAILPNGSSIYKTKEINIFSIDLTTQKTKKIENALGNNFFYCPTFDITHPYPSEQTVSDYDPEFCWNQKWRIAFEKVDASFACTVLLQGYIGSKSSSSIYIARRSIYNPYTRYTSRGISEGCPANELECELIFLEDKRFWSNCWRRGSAPVKWRSAVSGISVIHNVLDNDPEETHCYFIKILKRFQIQKIHVLSLLEGNGFEKELSNSYQKSIQSLDFVDFHEFNINTLGNGNSLQKAISFQNFLSSTFLTSEPIFTEGEVDTVTKRQNTIMRFNCVDSTDRTNIATFFYARALAERKGFCKIDRDLLIPLFLKSGNVISYFYMLSDATKTQIIRIFTPNTDDVRFKKCFPHSIISTSKSDAALTITRRLKVNSFYEVDNNISEWLTADYKPPLTYTIDWTHLLIITNSKMILNYKQPMPDSILHTNTSCIQCDLNQFSSEIILKLPKPMRISHLTLIVMPNSPTSFTLSCGMDENTRHIWLKDISLPIVQNPIPLRYSLIQSSRRWNISAPFDIHGTEPSRFVWITFKCDNRNNSKVTISNVFIDGIITNEYQVQKFDANTYNQSSINEYEKKIQNFFEANNRNLSDYMELEIFRIKNRISLDLRNLITIRLGYNPFYTSILSKLKADLSKCYFCSKITSYNEAVPTFWVPNFWNLLDYDRRRVETCQKPFKLCNNCYNQIKQFEKDIKELEYKLTTINKKVNKSEIIMKNLVKGSTLLSLPDQTCFLEYPLNCSNNNNINNLLIDNDEVWSIDLQVNNLKDLMFTICLPTYSIVSSISIEFIGDLPKTISILSLSKQTFEIIVQNNVCFLVFKTPFITESITFVLTPNVNQKFMTMKLIKFFGEFINRPLPPPILESVDPTNRKLVSIHGETDPNNRTMIYRIQEENLVLTEIGFLVDVNYDCQPQSIAVSIFRYGKLQKYYQIIIPQIQNKRMLIYKLDDEQICDVCIVHYIDLSQQVFAPYTTLFGISIK